MLPEEILTLIKHVESLTIKVNQLIVDTASAYNPDLSKLISALAYQQQFLQDLRSGRIQIEHAELDQKIQLIKETIKLTEDFVGN